LLMMIFWKEFKILSFDPDFGASLGFPIRWLDTLLTTLIVIAIVIGLQAVGVVLMSSMVVAPAVAARQWTNRMHVMVLLSAFFGAVAGIMGTVISSLGRRISTGPTIVLSISFIVLVSLLFAPNRGLVWRWIQSLQNRRKMALETVLLDLYTLASKHGERSYGHSKNVLRTMHAGDTGIMKSLKELQSRGLVHQDEKDTWALTDAGWVHAEELAEVRGNIT
jgi:manganese/zinc/iron transport system permease protein